MNLLYMVDIKSFLEAQIWTNAKTYEKFAPHEYILVNKCRDIIRQVGNEIYCKNINTIPVNRWNREWRYLYIKPYVYWFHAKPLNDTHVIALYGKKWETVTIDKYLSDVKVLNRTKWKV